MSEATFQEIYGLRVRPFFEGSAPRIPDPDVLQALAAPLWTGGRIAEALACIQLIDRRAALQPTEHVIRGFWRLHEVEIAEAKRDFVEALAVAPHNHWARFGYAFALFFEESYQRAAEEFEALIASGAPLKGPIRMAPAARALVAGEAAEAVELSPIPDLPPGMNEALQVQRSQGIRAGLGVALDAYRSLPDEIGLPVGRLALEWMLELQMNEPAEQLWSYLSRVDPWHGLTVLLGGFVLARQGDLDASYDCFEWATRVAPFNAHSWAGYAAGLTARGDLEEAERCLRVALFLDDKRVPFWTDLGQLCARRNDFDAALPCFQRARALGDTSFGVLLNTGIAALYSSDSFIAYSNFGLALRVAPVHPRADEVRSIAARPLQGDPRYVFGDIWFA